MAARRPPVIRLRRLLAILAILAAGCTPTVFDIVQQADTIRSKAELRRALGPPAAMAKLGSFETWTYEARDGEVTFLIQGDNVVLLTGGNLGADPGDAK